MSYDIVLGDLAREAIFPYPFGQVYRFGLRHAGEVYLFAAHFYYGEDERTLRVFDLRFSRE